MSRVGDPPVIREDLRRDLIDLIERHQGGAVSLLDAMLDLLTERADEWVKATGLRVIPGPLMLLAVLRNPGSKP